MTDRGRAPAGATALGALAAAALAVGAASAQTVEFQRPKTLVVGTPRGGARADRVDGARSGYARTSLPSSGLRTEWRTPLGMLVEQPPLVDARGTTYVVGTRGEVVALGPDGSERWRTSTGGAQPGPPALLSDDAVVFVDSAGEAIAVRDGVVRWRVRFGRVDSAHPAPLPLDDGGVVVATSREVSALDSEGHERARMVLPEPTKVPLVAALGKIAIVAVSGTVWSWAPGATELTRVGSFGVPVDSGAALADDHTLVAVAGGGVHLAAVDLLRGTASVRAVAAGGIWLGSPATHLGTTHLVLLTPTSELAVAVDVSGGDALRTLLTAHAPVAAPDGGATAAPALAHTPMLVDASGALAFATIGGAIGVASGGGIELLSDACEPPLGSAVPATPTVIGLAPLEVGAFVAVCHAGAAMVIRGDRPGQPPAAGRRGGGERAAPLL